jgi:cytochrome c-type biogenesis protein CcmF
VDVGGLGPASLAVALVAAGAATVLAVRGRAAAAGRAVWIAFAGLSVAVVVLGRALVGVDGSLVYVADHTSRATAWPYRLAGLWGGMAGSLLLWTWMAGGWAVVGGRAVRRRSPDLAAAAHVVLGSYLVVFCALLVLVSRPFDRLAVPAIDGGGLNPVLLHPAMLYHPPLLYAGAVGLLVPFALAMAGGDSARWLPLAVRSTGASLVLLTLGMVAGAHWAYVELGWGGYWAWDPVENGGLLPWLAGVAFLHAAVAAGRRGGGSRTAAALAALAFSLGLLGSFLTRSGATDSVHAFAEARVVGWVLGGGLVVAVTAVAVLLGRRREVPGRSAHWALTANNVLLVGLVVVIGFGSVFPVLARWLTGDRVVVTGSYFALVAAPLAVAMLPLLGLGPRADARDLRPGLVGLVAAVVAGMWFVDRRPLAIVMVGLAAGAAAFTVTEWRRRPQARWPLAHLGVAVLLAGVAGTTTGTQVTASLTPGQEVGVRGYTLRLLDVVPATSPDGGRAAEARIVLRRGGGTLATLRPVALLSSAGGRVSVAALRSTPLTDVQVVLRSVTQGGASVVVDVGVHPLMQLVWWGGLLIVAGLGVGLRSGARRGEPRPGGRASQPGSAPATTGAPGA